MLGIIEIAKRETKIVYTSEDWASAKYLIELWTLNSLTPISFSMTNHEITLELVKRITAPPCSDTADNMKLRAENIAKYFSIIYEACPSQPRRNTPMGQTNQ